jgi:hypothetical protein
LFSNGEEIKELREEIAKLEKEIRRLGDRDVIIGYLIRRDGSQPIMVTARFPATIVCRGQVRQRPRHRGSEVG